MKVFITMCLGSHYISIIKNARCKCFKGHDPIPFYIKIIYIINKKQVNTETIGAWRGYGWNGDIKSLKSLPLGYITYSLI